MLKEMYNAKSTHKLSLELKSWFQKTSSDHIRQIIDYFESKNENNTDKDKVMDRIIEKFGQNNCRVS